MLGFFSSVRLSSLHSRVPSQVFFVECQKRRGNDYEGSSSKQTGGEFTSNKKKIIQKKTQCKREREGEREKLL